MLNNRVSIEKADVFSSFCKSSASTGIERGALVKMSLPRD